MKVAALILAAGQSRRMGGPHKLLATVDGKPLVRIAAGAALASRARPVTVVTGHRADAVEGALDGLDARLVHNPAHAEGLSTSLRAGIASLPAGIDGVVVLLADMPGVTAAIIDRLIAAFDPEHGASLIVPSFEGKWGNPVLWSSRYFGDLMAVKGDTGGRRLMEANSAAVMKIELGSAVLLDIDTPQALAAAGGKPPKG